MELPQGSFLGPVLRNIFCDAVGEFELPVRFELVVCTDDSALIGTDLGDKSLKYHKEDHLWSHQRVTP